MVRGKPPARAGSPRHSLGAIEGQGLPLRYGPPRRDSAEERRRAFALDLAYGPIPATDDAPLHERPYLERAHLDLPMRDSADLRSERVRRVRRLELDDDPERVAWLRERIRAIDAELAQRAAPVPPPPAPVAVARTARRPTRPLVDVGRPPSVRLR
jgi:hypothetical protein